MNLPQRTSADCRIASLESALCSSSIGPTRRRSRPPRLRFATARGRLNLAVMQHEDLTQPFGQTSTLGA